MTDLSENTSAPFSGRASAPVRFDPPRQGFDLATLLGLFGAAFFIGAAIWMGGNWIAFVDWPSVLMVVFGTLCITTISYSLPEIIQAQPVMLRTIFARDRSSSAAAKKMLQLAERARQRGLLAMQSEPGALRSEAFLQRAMTLLVDGMPIEEVERNLTFETHAMAQRHQRTAGILRRAAEVSPAMGLIGTLVGLVQMLGTLDKPENIGPAMAVALLTTFYGAIMANVLFLPLASKLDRNSAGELLINQIFILGVLSIARQENPRRLELVLNTILPASHRVRYFD
jgi:chemotaxis protein MotA